MLHKNKLKYLAVTIASAFCFTIPISFIVKNCLTSPTLVSVGFKTAEVVDVSLKCNQEDGNQQIHFKPISATQHNTIQTVKDKKNAPSPTTSSPTSENFQSFLTDATERDLQDHYVNLHRYEFIIKPPRPCNAYLLILIHSAAKNFRARKTIRSTWGAVKHYNGVAVVSFFLLGRTDALMQKQIDTESQQNNDIIQGDFIDTYRNLSYKNVMGLHWTENYCNSTKYILKVDDDVLVNIYKFLSYLLMKSEKNEFGNYITCPFFGNRLPQRETEGKWYVSMAYYPYLNFPPYCRGFVYFLTSDVRKRLYEASRTVKLLWLDDVYVTGFIAFQAGVTHRNFEEGYSFQHFGWKSIGQGFRTSVFFLSKGNEQIWYEIWNDIQKLQSNMTLTGSTTSTASMTSTTLQKKV